MGRNVSIDFFISYNKADKKKADWIGWQLEAADYKVWTPDWDIHTGNNEIIEIDKALRDAEGSNTERRVILILSPNFRGETVQENVWTSVSARDANGSKGLLVPIIVLPNPHIPSQLQSIKRIDLSACKDEGEAVSILLKGVSLARHKPNGKPPFFGNDKPSFWGEAGSIESSAGNPRQREVVHVIEKKPPPPEYRLGLLDKKKQARQIVAQIPQERCLCNGKAWGFLLTGSRHEWPQALRYKLAYGVETDLMLTLDHAPELVKLDADKVSSKAEPPQYLWELLGMRLNCKSNPSAIKNTLEGKKVCQVIYRELSSDESSDQEFLAKILTAWSELQLATHSPSHFLLLIRETELEEKSGRAWFWKRRISWFEKMQAVLVRCDLRHCLLPPLETPKWEDDINDWLKQHVNEEFRDALKTAITKVHGKAPAIPHRELKKLLLPLLK